MQNSIRTVILLLAVLTILASAACAQSCPAQAMIVNVLNPRGLPIPDLPASSFKATAAGKPVTVLSAGLRSDPSTRTYILLDMGATMGGIGAQGVDKWKIARAAAREFLSTAQPQADISLFTFSAAINRKFLSGDGRQPMEDWLNSPESLRPSALKGKSAIHQTIVEAAEAMKTGRPGDSIFVVSDGRGDLNESTAANIAEDLQQRGVRLFSFVLDDSRRADFSGSEAGGLVASVGPVNPGATLLGTIVKASGGLGYTLYPGGSRIGQSFGLSYDYDEHMRQNVRTSVSAIQIAVNNYYVLALELPDDARAQRDFQLELVDARGKIRKDVSLVFPARIAGCMPSTAIH